MDVRPGHGCIDAKSFTIFHASQNSSLNNDFIDEFEGLGSQPIVGAVEGVMLGHGMAVELGESSQRVPIGDAFRQLPIVPNS